MSDVRLKIARSDILELFGKETQKIFTRARIGEILSGSRDFWRLSDSTSLNKFIAFLLEQTKLREVRLEFPARTEIRYTWGDVSLYELVFSLKPGPT